MMMMIMMYGSTTATTTNSPAFAYLDAQIMMRHQGYRMVKGWEVVVVACEEGPYCEEVGSSGVLEGTDS